ncbi:MAG TPA: MFS transporter [Streptosporangiaceae bacterium]|nr:MFS transporter [Streptosporangiaceae bacterium]
MLSAARLRAWLPPGRHVRLLIGASFVDSLGTGLFIAGSAVFFTRVLGLSTVQVGIGLSLAGLAGFLGMVPVGWLADRFGGKRTIMALYLWRGCCFTVYPFIRTPVVFYLVAFLIGIAEWGGGPVIQGIVGALEGDDSRVKTMAVIFSTRNAGFSIGAVLATLVVALGSKAAFAGLVFADAATFFVTAALQSRLPAAANARTRSERTEKRGVRVHDLRFLALAGLNGILFLHATILTAGLPLWIATRKTAAPLPLVGIIVLINTIVVIGLQVRLSAGASGISSAARRQNWAGWALAACCVLVALSARTGSAGATVLLIGATIALTLGEIWQGAGAWRLSFSLAPEDRRATYLSVYELGISAASAVGPALLTRVVIGNGRSGWIGLAGCFLLTGLLVVLVAEWARPAARHRKIAEPIAPRYVNSGPVRSARQC